MKNKLKKGIIALGVGGAIVAGAILLQPKPMPYQEYQDYIEMMNYEVKHLDGKIENVNSKKDLIKKLNDRVLNRRVDKAEAMIKMHNKNYSTSTYTEKRQDLINKAEQALR